MCGEMEDGGYTPASAPVDLCQNNGRFVNSIFKYSSCYEKLAHLLWQWNNESHNSLSARMHIDSKEFLVVYCDIKCWSTETG
jgi:hypothetical protein